MSMIVRIRTLKSIRVSSLIVILLLLSATIIPVQFLGSSLAWDATQTIYVYPDGSIEPFTAPMSKVGNTYTLTDDISTWYDGIVFMANDSILDGGGHKLGPPSKFMSATGLKLDGLHSVEVRNIVIENFLAGLIVLNSTSLWIHDSVFVNNSNSMGDRSVWISGTCTDLNISHNTVLGFSGVEIGGVATRVDVYDNDIECSYMGMHFNNSTDVHILGNKLLCGGGDCITSGWLEHAVIANNQFLLAASWPGHDGLRLGSSIDCVIKSNNFANCSANAIRITGTNRDTKILNNTFQYNGQAILIDGSASHTVVSGNRVLSCEGGIQFYNSSVDTIILNNTISYHNFSTNETDIWYTGITLGSSWAQRGYVHRDARIIGNTIEVHFQRLAILVCNTTDLLVSENVMRGGGLALQGPTLNCTVCNNSVEGSSWYGIAFWEYTFNCTVCNNSVVDDNCQGIAFYGGMVTAARVTDNIISNFSDAGIIFENSLDSTVSRNYILHGNETYRVDSINAALVFINSCNNSIIENTIQFNCLSGILLRGSSGNEIIGNKIRYNYHEGGLDFQTSSSNLVYDNIINSNPFYDIYFSIESTNNLVYHNALNSSNDINCEPQTVNSWDSGYPAGGNLWTAYQGTDLYHGSLQNLKGSDGIYDQPYVIDSTNSDRYPLVQLENRTIIGVNPMQGGNAGPVTVRLYGLAATDITDATLVRQGQPPISATHPFTVNGVVYAVFDLLDQEPGVCDLVLRKNDSTIITIPSSFTIIAGGEPQLKIDFIGRDTIRKGGNGTYFVRVSNVGDIDSGWTLLRLMAEYPTMIYKISCILECAPSESGGGPLSWGVVKATVFDKDEPLPLDQEDFLGLEDFVIWNVPAGSSLLYEVQIHCDRNETDPVLLVLGIIGSVVIEEVTVEYFVNVANEILIHLGQPDPFTIETWRDIAKNAWAKTYNELVPWGNNQFWSGMSINMIVLKCIMKYFHMDLFSDYKLIMVAIKTLKFAYDIFEAGDRIDVYSTKWLDPNYPINYHRTHDPQYQYPWDSSEEAAYRAWAMGKRVTPVTSHDPNEIVGPQGYGAEGFISHTDRSDYIIFFENMANATAPAEKITVTDQLDPDLDWTTLTIGPMSHTQNVTVDFNSTTGTITWTFENINLPPNKVPPEGEGYVSYSVATKEGLPSGTEISAEASIVFDYNAPLATNTYVNTIDIVQPSSNVIAMSPTQPNNFTVSWQGSDGTGSGVGWFSVFVSTDGGAFALWRNITNATSALFNGTIGHTYSFYSVAYDNVGNKEDAPTNPDLTVTIVAPLMPLQVTARCEPASITSGEHSTLNITVMSQGVGVAGAIVILGCPDGGSVSSVTDLGGGYYSAIFTGPNTSEEITCSISISVEKSGYVSNTTSVSLVVKPPGDILLPVLAILIVIVIIVAVAAVMMRRKKPGSGKPPKQQ